MARILVVDDEGTIRASLKRMLEMNGYEVVLAENGEEGDRLYRENPTDLVITDLVMPEKEGLEFYNGLIDDYPDMKVILISGGGRKIEGEDLDFILDVAKGSGVVDTFRKPFDVDELLKSVEKHLAQA
ncbi:hypothetical protein MNBD_NITROSPINAE01-88 [hydrothermal vent metagenome]|uniref:Response regulatory domain-containing protein n=1 Tax=hydrothermal vent metagenome TaxID=652676 RepID=A0A3B1BSS9_9ZZZZ